VQAAGMAGRVRTRQFQRVRKVWFLLPSAGRRLSLQLRLRTTASCTSVAAAGARSGLTSPTSPASSGSGSDGSMLARTVHSREPPPPARSSATTWAAVSERTSPFTTTGPWPSSGTDAALISACHHDGSTTTSTA
jgi:hypothetical protein